MPYTWKPFLETWSAALAKSRDAEHFDLPPEAVRSGWIGYPGAAEAQIQAAEVRLGKRLPPSYRGFLQVTNGWRFTGTSIYKMWNTEEIDWFPVRNQNWIDVQSMFPDAVGEDDDSFPPVEHLRAALEISDLGDAAIYLLNPLVVRPDGEWQAIFMASWLPGARRYPSFWDMMQDEYQTFVMLNTRDQKRYRIGSDLSDLPQKISDLLALLHEEEQNAQRARGTMSAPTQPYYFNGWLRAIQDAVTRVQHAAAESATPDALLDALWTLASTLQQESLELDSKTRSANVSVIFRIMKGDMSISEDAGAIIGKQKAAGVIRWFLEG